MSVNINFNAPVYIIAQCGENVNPYGGEINFGGAEKKLTKWAEHKQISAKIAAKLKRAGYERRAERMKECSDTIEYKWCEDCNGLVVRRANLCRDRFCSTCQWRLSLQRYATMQRIIDSIGNGYPEASYSLITLTVKNCKATELAKTLEKMSAAWHLVCNQVRVRPHLYGWAKSIELTYNKATQELHPHMHVLIMWADEAADEHAKVLIDYWIKAATKKGLTADIKAQHAAEVQTKEGQTFEGAVLETFKYAVKSKEIQYMPQEVFAEVVRQWANKRLVAFGGLIKKYAKLTEADSMEEVQDDDIQIDCCRCCGSTAVHDLIYKWAFGEKRYKPLIFPRNGNTGGVTPTVGESEDE